MIKSRYVVDEVEVKKINEERPTWTATCPICKRELTGTLAQLRNHGETCHGK